MAPHKDLIWVAWLETCPQEVLGRHCVSWLLSVAQWTSLCVAHTVLHRTLTLLLQQCLRCDTIRVIHDKYFCYHRTPTEELMQWGENTFWEREVTPLQSYSLPPSTCPMNPPPYSSCTSGHIASCLCTAAIRLWLDSSKSLPVHKGSRCPLILIHRCYTSVLL
jgi:hypothetical protein